MRKSLLVVLTTFALVLGFAAVAGAALPSYKVTLKLSTTSSQAGKFIIVSGTVTGPRSIGRPVTIQRQYLGGAWTNVAFPVVKKNGTFSARVETPRGGTTSFRAIKPKSSVRKAGVSPTRATKVYEWLYLASQSGVGDGEITRGAEHLIDGKNYKRSLLWGGNNAKAITFKLGGLCTQFAAVAHYYTSGNPGADSMEVVVTRQQVSSSPLENTTIVDSDASGAPITSSMLNTKFLTIEIQSLIEGGQYFAALGDPKVYCNASFLPSFSAEDF